MFAARPIASPIVWPSTNWRPSSRMACLTAVRITGSPRRLTAPPMTEANPPEGGARSTFPVSISAQVEALTSEEADLPRCSPQADGAILSSISASIVSVSGTRRSDSARHISAMPSSVERPYSARNTSIIPGVSMARMSQTRVAARRCARVRTASSTGARCAIAATASVSSARCIRAMAARCAASGPDGFSGAWDMGPV